MASAGLEEELKCSICLTLYTNPVTLRCGHNFCRACIEQHLNTQDESGRYSCPECREEFQERPALINNITLHNVVENVLTNHGDDASILCTYCIHSPVPAVRSCLHCEASLCDKHLEVHNKGPEHVLTDPSSSLEKRKCSVHKKILEYYCTEDAACICVSCCLIGEHSGHKLESLDEASKKKENLRNLLQKLITNREKTEESVRSLEERRRKAQEKAAGEAERVPAMFIEIRRLVDDMEKTVFREISRREEKESRSLSYMIQNLEMEKDELSRKMRHIEELCNMTDPLTVLQEPDTGDLCDPEEEGDEATGGHDGGDEATGGGDEATGGGDEATGGHDGGDEATGGHDGGDEVTGGHDGGDEATGGHDGGDEATGGHDGGDEDTGGHDGGDEATGGHDGGDWAAELISHISRTLSAMIRDITVTFYVQDPADILLDVNTAANNLLISDDLKTATWTRIRQNRPETAERFQEDQVMSGRGFTSGRHYWDVEIRGSVWWRVGMCYPSIDRRGRQSDIGDNNKSWCLYGGCMYNNQYLVRHDSNEIQLPHQISSDGVGICLDYEAGQLSFYELCDPIRHLHTFTATFSEPLHAVLYIGGGSIKISEKNRQRTP